MMRVNVRLNIHDFGKFTFKENREAIEKKEEKDNLLGYVFPDSAAAPPLFLYNTK